MTTWYCAGPALRKTASGEDWTHGSGRLFNSFYDKHGQHGDNAEEVDYEKHWNTHIGPHFTSVHDTAEDFASNSGGDNGGHVYHVNLKMKNPKHYRSEFEMDEQAYHHGRNKGIIEPLHPEDEKHMVAGRWEDLIRDGVHHGEHGEEGAGPHVAASFKQHLIDQGYDGITYGNEHEGPKLHKCAIAFHPHQVEITHVHEGNEPCTKDADDYWKQQASDYGKVSSLDLTEFFKEANAPNYDERGRLNHYRFQGHEPAEGEHAIFRGVFLGHETGEKERPTEPADVLKHIENYQRKHLERHGVDPEHERMNNYGSHWTTDASTAHKFSLDPMHGKWRDVRHSTKHPTVGAVLEVHTKEKPSNRFSQYGEGEIDNLPKRSEVTKAWLHVHRLDPHLEAKHYGEDFKKPDTWTDEFSDKINQSKPVSPYKQNTLLSTTEIQVPKGKKQSSLALTAFFKEAEDDHEVHYHLTDNPNFSLNKDHAPEDNALAINSRSGRKGLYVTPKENLDNWWSPAGQGYSRPYVAEIHTPKGTAKPERWGGEHFIPAEHFDKAKVHQVKPWDAHVREQFGDHGHIESHHGTEFDTGAPLRKNPESPHRPIGDYKYTGDTRNMSPEEQQHHQDRWKSYMKEDRGWSDEDFHKEAAANAEDELPPEPGTTPIPDGHIRLYHYTAEKNLPSIREQGLLEQHARGDGGMGAGNEPSAGVWASTQPPKNAHFVEFHAHPDEISDRAESPRRHTPEEFQKGNHHVIMRGDVKPHQIVAIHQPWHNHARFILGDPKALADTKRGANDGAMQFPDYAKAITHVKKHGSAQRYTHNTSPSLRSSIQEHGLKPGRQAFPEEHEHLEDWESAGDADSLWLHGNQPDPVSHSDTWEVTHPHLYDIQKGEDADEGTNYYRTNDTIAPEHLRLLHEATPRKTAGGYTHYSDHEFEPGDEVLPSGQTGRKRTQGYPFAYMSDKVYMAGEGHDPVTYHQHGQHAYEVEPVGKVERDYEFDYAKGQHLKDNPEATEDEVPGYHSYQAPKARVVRKISGGPLIFYPAMYGGKHHLTDPISGTARCRGTIEVNRDEPPIHVSPDQERIHPIICKRCLAQGRATQGRGKFVSGSLSPEYRLHYGQSDEGHHIIDAYHGAHDVGSAVFEPDGTLNELNVNPEHQRKGLATAMWEHAKSLGLNPQHSNERSKQGDAWAKSTGDPVPENLWPSHPDDDDDDAAQGRGEHVAAAQPLSEYSIKHQQFEDGFHQITAHHPEKGEVGFMGLDPDGTLNLAQVQPSHQRKGLATAMWEHAKSLGINPQHSNVRSREGDAWAKATGDPVPDNLSLYDNADPDEDHVENQSFSTAFTAPGYHHPYAKADMPHALGYEPKSPRTAALHDVEKPDTFHLYDSWGKSEEQKAADSQKAKDLHEQFHKNVIREGGLPEDTPKYEAENHWKRAVSRALTTGKKTIDEAEAQGYRGDGREHGEKVSTYENYYDKDKPRRGGYQNLSAHQSHFYHVGTDADAIKAEGLKTRREQGTTAGHGLGGGSDDTVSVTDDHDLATDIYHSLHEHHAVLNGKITPQQLHDYAKNPPKGKPFHEQLVKPGSHQEEDFERLKKGRTDELLPGHPAYQRTERDATPEEHTRRLSEFYKRFSTHRHQAGGHRDPLFISNDPMKFAKSDPEKFGVLALKPHPKAQGYPLDPNKGHHDRADSGEWRLGPGSPFDVTHVAAPYPRHEEEFENYPAEKKSDHGKMAKTAAVEDAYDSTFLGKEQGWKEVPRHRETGEPPTRAYRWAHRDAAAGYEKEGVPKGTYFSMDAPDDRYRASDHVLVSVPYSDEHFRSSHNLSNEHYISTTTTVPSHLVQRHEGKTASVSDIDGECHCASCNSLGMIPPGSDCIARKTASLDLVEFFSPTG